MKTTISYFALGSAILCGQMAYSQNNAKKSFIETKNIDPSIKPGDDFYDYANGSWLKTAKIPAEYTQTGAGMETFLTIQKRLQEILKNAAKNDGTKGSIQQKVGDFYLSGMDTITINKRNYEPAKPLLSKIEAANSIDALMQIEANEMINTNSFNLFGLWVYPDQKNSSKNITWLVQSGIGLPERDYYFRTDEKSIAIQNAYKNYLKQLFALTDSDISSAAQNAEKVYNIEKEIASSHKTAVELRDVKGNYHKFSLAKIEKDQPNIGWKKFFQNIGAKVDSVDMEQPEYYTKLNAMLKTVPISEWKIYMKAHSLNDYANLLSKDFQTAKFNYSKILSGQQKQRNRSELIAGKSDVNLGDALGELYVKEYFPPEAKQRVDQLIDNLVKTYANHITNLDWMSDATKKTALDKLNAITRKIAYPDKWRDYGNVNIDKTKYFENTIACNKNNFDFIISQLGKPVDKNLWDMTAPTLNAYYDPYHNDINFPAGILQFPFFDKDADDAVNYGAIGMVIGHELTHGFDDQGGQYDKVGNMKDWWAAEDKVKFDDKVKQIQKLYDGFPVLKNLNINGKLTTGENIADFGGVAIAYDAFKMTKQGQSNEKIDGLTPDQRFFLSYVNSWRLKMTDELTRLQVQTDPHSTSNWRINGPLMNFEAFYKAFDVKPGQKMYLKPENRIKIW